MMRVSTRSSCRNLEQISMRLARLIMRIAYVSTRFLCVDMEKFRPCGLTTRPSDATLAKYTTPRHILLRIPTDSRQITKRYNLLFYI